MSDFKVIGQKQIEEQGEGTYIRLYGADLVRFKAIRAVLDPESTKGGVKAVGEMIAKAGLDAAEAFVKAEADRVAAEQKAASTPKK